MDLIAQKEGTMNISENKTLSEWNELVNKLKAGEVDEGALSLFMASSTVMNQATYQLAVAADSEWRLHMMQLHERQVELIRRQAVALERIVKCMEGEYDD